MITQEDKKNLIALMFSINQMLDTFRTNLNIVQYNILTNDKMQKLPKFDYDLIKKICTDLGNALSGTIKEYNEMKATAPIAATQKTTNAEAIKEIKKNKKDTYKTFGGIYPSEYANPKSKYNEGDNKK